MGLFVVVVVMGRRMNLVAKGEDEIHASARVAATNTNSPVVRKDDFIMISFLGANLKCLLQHELICLME